MCRSCRPCPGFFTNISNCIVLHEPSKSVLEKPRNGNHVVISLGDPRPPGGLRMTDFGALLLIKWLQHRTCRSDFLSPVTYSLHSLFQNGRRGPLLRKRFC